MTTKERLHELVDELPDEDAELLLAYLQQVVASAEGEDDLPPELMTRLAALGGSFDWLHDEPDLYTLEDGVAIDAPTAASATHGLW